MLLLGIASVTVAPVLFVLVSSFDVAPMGAAAKWSLDGDKVYHDIDIAQRPQWAGTRQVRHFTFHGDMLTLRPPVSMDVAHNVVTNRALHWRKVV